jgi:hypothetical protein
MNAPMEIRVRLPAERVLQVGTRLTQSRITYYFQNPSPDLSVAAQLPYLLDLAAPPSSRTPPLPSATTARCCSAPRNPVLNEIGEQFLGLRDAAPATIIDVLARDHLLDDAGE